MGLAEVLSAVRELVLEDGPPTGTPDERKAALARRFRTLSAREVDDLANVPPERFRVYTDLIFSGDRSVLQWIFPMTLEALVRLTQEDGDERSRRDIEMDLARELHRKKPWQSSSTRELALNFHEFVLQQRKNLIARWRGVVDLMVYERTNLEVHHAKDVAADPIDVEAWRALDDTQLAQQPIVRPAYVLTREYGVDVLQLAAQHRRDRQLPAEWPAAPGVLLACGRRRGAPAPLWVRLTPSGFAALQALHSGTPTTMGDLLGGFLSVQDAGGLTEQSRKAFFTQFQEWATAGLVLQPREM